MNCLDRIHQLSTEIRNAQDAFVQSAARNAQLNNEVALLRSQLSDARKQLEADSATIAKLAKDKQDIWLRCDSGDELLNAILLWIEADMRQTPPPAESMAAFFLTTFCKNTRAHISRHA